MSQSRRLFLKSSAAYSLGLAGLQSFVAASDGSGELAVASASSGQASTASTKLFGPLVSDPEGLLDLPKGFSYHIVGRAGDTMDDGFFLPGAPDGMATFQGPGDQTIVIRNHEITPDQEGPFGEDAQLLETIDPALLYDHGMKGKPCIGGTTTFVYDTKKQKLVKQYLSLTGTVRNCSGGPTPWGTWITCEEANDVPGVNVKDGKETICEQFHGYNFEVPATTDTVLSRAVPLKAMGRFRHEAVAVEPESGIVYQTEDLDDGLIYRFIPNKPGVLALGGRLQALVIADAPSADTRNWSDDQTFRVGESHAVRWIDLDEVESPQDDLRYRGFSAGAARFARGEGMWYADGAIYFACTSGGSAELGQLWKYTPSAQEGKSTESEKPGELELFVEPNDSQLVVNADNLTAAPWGDLIVSEDRSGQQVRLVGVTPQGELYTFANSHARTEFAGAAFSPDGSTLFVNVQGKGLTLAITGPWPDV